MEVKPRSGKFVFLPGNLLGCRVLWVSGGMALLVGLALRFVRVMLVFDGILLGSWLSFVFFFGLSSLAFYC